MLRIVEVDVMKQPSCVVLCIALATSECAEQYKIEVNDRQDEIQTRACMITRLRNVKPTRRQRKHAQAAHNNDGGVLTVVPGVRAVLARDSQQWMTKHRVHTHVTSAGDNSVPFGIPQRSERPKQKLQQGVGSTRLCFES